MAGVTAVGWPLILYTDLENLISKIGRATRAYSSAHMATTSLMPVGNAADSPAPLRGPSSATGHDAEMLEG
jgi:hypothetical protein